MSVKFNSYEFIGVVTPGAISLVGILYIFPELKQYLLKSGGNLGNLGLFLVFAYASGQLVGAIGNLLEFFWWIGRGQPTNWVRKEKQKLISSHQKNKLQNRIQEMYPKVIKLSEITVKDWHPITREIYAEISKRGSTKRIEVFNRNYGLMRGLTAAFLCFGALYALGVKVYDSNTTIFIFSCLIASAYRMNRFAKLYARELFIEFLSLPIAPPMDIPASNYLDEIAS